MNVPRIVALSGAWLALGCGKADGPAPAPSTSSGAAVAPAPSASPRTYAPAPSASAPVPCHAAWPMPNVPAPGLPHPQSYDLTDPAAVGDRVTGLSWERALDPGVYNLATAIDHCARASLGGHRDWRLPAVIELTSIADVTRADPAVDPAVFPGTPPRPFWTSQRDVGNAGLAWYVFFKNGGVYGGNDVVDPQPVRCVRGPSACVAAAAPYHQDGDAVRDTATSLVWQVALDHDTLAWTEAKAYCAGRAPRGAWRLPSLRELLTLVDFARTEPAIDATSFPDTPSELFWSSSPSRAPAGTAWGVNFTRGSSGAALTGQDAHVRCVR